jgi:drug/metabolite transporter (DMT)-like permease
MTTISAKHATSFSATAALVLATLFWSGNFIAGRALGGVVPPLELNLLRWALCLALLLPFTAGRLFQYRRQLRANFRLIGLLGATGIAAFHTMVYQALTLTPAVNTLLMLALAPVLTVAGGLIWNGYRPGPAAILGIGLSLVGAVAITAFGSGSGSAEIGFDVGAVWMGGAVIVWAAYTLLLRHRPADLPQDVTLASSIIVALALMAPLLAFVGYEAIAWTPGVAAAVAYVAVFASLLGFGFWSYGVSILGPERSGQFVHLMPIFGTVMAIVLLGEQLRPAHVAGGGLIVAGLILINLPASAFAKRTGPRRR